MSNVVMHSKNVLWWFTTPDELRAVADSMEKRIKETKLGESLTVSTKHFGGGELRITVDQEKVKVGK